MPQPPWGSSYPASIQGLASGGQEASSLATTDPTTWSKRYGSGEQKGEGYFGLMIRPDQSSVMGEYSVGVPVGGKDMEVPSMVPTLNDNEMNEIMTAKEGQQLSPSIYQKAGDFASQRLAQGKSVWAQHGEQDTTRFPQYQRSQIQMPQVMGRTGQPINPNTLSNALQGLLTR